MVQKLYLCAVVVCRAAGLFFVGTSVLGILIGTVLSGRSSIVAMALSTSPMLLGGVLLWALAKPVGRLVTSGLED